MAATHAGAMMSVARRFCGHTDDAAEAVQDAFVSAFRAMASFEGTAKLGTKTELKNLNSFSAVERALDAEFTRQCALLSSGEPVVQQTMLWDAKAERVVGL